MVGLGGTWGLWWDLVELGGTWWDLVGLNDLGGTCVLKLTYLWMGLPSRPIKGGDL